MAVHPNTQTAKVSLMRTLKIGNTIPSQVDPNASGIDLNERYNKSV
jgi:hypothetical protein